MDAVTSIPTPYTRTRRSSTSSKGRGGGSMAQDPDWSPPEEEAPAKRRSTRKSSKVCASCRTRKISCTMVQPCGACVKTKLKCVYDSLPPQPKTIQEKEAAVDDVGAQLTSLVNTVNDLSTRLALSPDDLFSLYEQASDLVGLPLPPATIDIVEPEQKPVKTPSPSKRRTRSSTTTTARTPSLRAKRNKNSSNDYFDSSPLFPSDSYPSSHRQPPPLPLIGSTGLVSGRLFHFPITHSTKAPTSLDTLDDESLLAGSLTTRYVPPVE